MRAFPVVVIATLWSASVFASESKDIVRSDQATDVRAFSAFLSSQEPIVRGAEKGKPRLSEAARAAMAAPAPWHGVYNEFRPSYSWGVNVGAVAAINNPIRSSAGFYLDGNVDQVNTGLLVGTSFFYNGWRFGAGTEAFTNYTLSVGAVIDYFTTSSPSLVGRCGGLECRGGITIHQLNFIPEIKLTTSIGPNTTANIYYGLGFAILSPTGQPTGDGGPRLRGSDTAIAHRVGGGISQRVTGNMWWDFKTGYQWTGPMEFETDLAGERFQFDTRGDYYATVGFSFAFDNFGTWDTQPLRR